MADSTPLAVRINRRAWIHWRMETGCTKCWTAGSLQEMCWKGALWRLLAKHVLSKSKHITTIG